MRTTLNIDDKTYRVVQSLASANRQSVSRTVDQLLAIALKNPSPHGHADRCDLDSLTGFPVFRSKRTVTDEDVVDLVAEE